MLILDRSPGAPPLYRQLYQQLRGQILSGALPAGTRLTPTRLLAQELGVSRNTVENAYQQLLAEGFLDSRVGSGYAVLSPGRAPAPTAPMVAEPPAPDRPLEFCLEYGRGRPDQFPTPTWKKAVSAALQQAPYSRYCPAAGLAELREQLALYLGLSRGVACSPGQIVIGGGTQPLVDLICQLLRLSGQPPRPGMEEPGYDGVRQVFQNNGCPARPIPVEGDGIDPAALEGSGCNLVYLTPSHQFPLGGVLPVGKRLTLIDWAQRTGGYLLEDDYDSEFRYASDPIPSLQSLWPDGSVFYLGTFAKALSPGVRLSYLVLPAHLVPLYRRHYRTYHNPVPVVTQLALAQFMQQGAWQRHLRRQLARCRRLHDALTDELGRELDGLAQLSGRGAGLHVLLRSTRGLEEATLIARCRALEMEVFPLSPYYQGACPPGGCLMLGFGSLTLEDIPVIVRRLRRAFDPEDKLEDVT